MGRSPWGPTLTTRRSGPRIAGPDRPDSPSAGAASPLDRDALLAVLDQLPIGVFVVDPAGRPAYTNVMSAKILGRGTVFDTPMDRIANAYEVRVAGTDDHYPADQMPVARALRGETCRVDDIEIARPDRRVPVRVWAAPIQAPGGAVAYGVAAFEDSTDLRDAERASRENDQRFRAAFDHAPIGMALLAEDGRFLQVNHAICQLTGYAASDLLTRRFCDILNAEDAVIDERSLAALLQGEEDRQSERRFARPDGELRWGRISRSLVNTSEGGPVKVIAHIEDVTELKRTSDAIAHQAFHDRLTGLPNRALLMDRLQGGLDRMGRGHGEAPHVFYLDVDNLKPINDQLGHARGDEALAGLARALEGAVRSGDTVARVGGDEFVVLCENMDEASEAVVRDKVEAAVRSVVVDGVPHGISVSVGCARAATQSETPAELLARADQAMYDAKRQRRSRPAR